MVSEVVGLTDGDNVAAGVSTGTAVDDLKGKLVEVVTAAEADEDSLCEDVGESEGVSVLEELVSIEDAIAGKDVLVSTTVDVLRATRVVVWVEVDTSWTSEEEVS